MIRQVLLAAVTTISILTNSGVALPNDTMPAAQQESKVVFLADQPNQTDIVQFGPHKGEEFTKMGMGKCMGCHTEEAKKDANKKHLTSCNTCHPQEFLDKMQ